MSIVCILYFSQSVNYSFKNFSHFWRACLVWFLSLFALQFHSHCVTWCVYDNTPMNAIGCVLKLDLSGPNTSHQFADTAATWKISSHRVLCRFRRSLRSATTPTQCGTTGVEWKVRGVSDHLERSDQSRSHPADRFNRSEHVLECSHYDTIGHDRLQWY